MLSALVLSLSTLLTVSMPLAHAATFVCTWTGADSGNSSGISDASNWSSCGSGTLDSTANTYIFIFPQGGNAVQPVLDTSLTVSSVTFQGDNYHITSTSGSNALTVTGDITTSGTSLIGNEMDVNISLTGNTPTISGNASGPLVIGDGSETLAEGTSALTLGDVVINNPVTGSGSLTISNTGTGNVELAHADSFSGSVNVSQGSLAVESTNGLTSASAITVANGGVLKGNGAVSGVTVQTGGTLAPGDSPGCLTATTLNLSGTYAAEIGGNTACTGYDQIQVSGAATLSGSLQISFVNGYVPSVGQTFTLLTSGTLSGTFAGLAEGATFSSGGATFSISYVGNNVVVTVITPPAGAAAAPKSPNTGLAARLAQPWAPLALMLLAALSLLGVARGLRATKE